MNRTLEIDRRSPIPAGEQLRQHIRGEIARSALTAGDRMPSVRDLAKEVGLSTATVQKVYADLMDEGLVVARQGAGVFIAVIEPKVSWDARTRVLNEKIDALITDAALLGVSNSNLRKLFFQREGLFGRRPRVKPIPRPSDD